jgi:hypothetical protein
MDTFAIMIIVVGTSMERWINTKVSDWTLLNEK